MNTKYRPLFEPFKIRNLEIKNRFCMAPMGTIAECDEQNTYTRDAVEYYAARARGGVGLIITGANWVDNDVEPHAPAFFPCPGTSPDLYEKRAKDLVDMCHAFGAAVALQLTAGLGRSALPSAVSPERFVAPSPVGNRWTGDPCRELTTAEVEHIVKKFAESAKIAQKIGFDGVEIHAVHEGYLLDCFTMAIFNQRKDKYGGDLRGRLTFAIEILQAIKAACGPDFPVILRFSIKSFIKALRQGGLPGETFKELGRDVEEALAAAQILQEAGYDAFDADAGTYDAWYWAHPPMYFDKGMYLPLTEQLKKVAKVPVIVAGRMDDPDMAAEALASGKLDAVGLGRQLLSDPDYVNKVKAGDLEDIRPCLGCHDGCFGRLLEGGRGSCAVNPACGREVLTKYGPAEHKKTVVVVGGGPAGMEAARVSALRGHKVTLFEAKSEIGGELLIGGRPSFKHDDLQLASWYQHQLRKLGVEVQVNTVANKAKVAAAKPDVVFVAEGSSAIALKTPGIGSAKVVYAEDVLVEKKSVGKSCLVVGGGLVGCELALHLAQNGKTVTIVEALADILKSGAALPPMNEFMLRDLLVFHKVRTLCSARLLAVTDRGAEVEVGGQKRDVPADSVIIAVGYKPAHALFDELKYDYVNVYNIGDGRKVRNIRAAIWDGFEVARVS